MVRIPPNGIEMNQWIAKQVLDQGVYGILWPHISTVEEARSAVAACRYARPAGAPRRQQHGDPGQRHRVIGKLDQHEVVRTVGNQGEWAHVKRDGGQRGWVAKRLTWGW